MDDDEEAMGGGGGIVRSSVMCSMESLREIPISVHVFDGAAEVVKHRGGGEEEDEEAEEKEEELQKEKELQALLSHAFDDLFVDEEEDEEEEEDDEAQKNGRHTSASQENGLPVGRPTSDWEGRYFVDNEWNMATGSSAFSSTHEQETQQQEQRKFLLNGEGSDSSVVRLEQLRVLYGAREREVERLRSGLERMEQDMTSRHHLLNEQLQSTLEEKERLEKKCSEEQEEREEVERNYAQLQAKFHRIQTHLGDVQKDKEKVGFELHNAESTIEALHLELRDLRSEENTSKAKETCARMVQGIRETHAQEVFRLNACADQLREEKTAKEEENRNLKERCCHLEKEVEKVNMEKAEVTKRLLKELELSQKEQEKLIKSRTGRENEISEMEPLLRDEIEQLKKELELAKKELESDNGIGKVENSDGLLSTLKAEVERSLMCLKRKNEELKQEKEMRHTIQNEAKIVQEKNKQLLRSLESAEGEVSELRSREQEKSAFLPELERLRREVDQFRSQLRSKDEEHAVHFRRMRMAYEEQLRAKEEEHVEQMRHVDSGHSERLRSALEERKRWSSEVHDLKELYLKVCAEKAQLEEQLTKRVQSCSEEVELKIKRAEVTWHRRMEEEVERMAHARAEELQEQRRKEEEEERVRMRERWEEEAIEKHVKQIAELEKRVLRGEEAYKRHLAEVRRRGASELRSQAKRGETEKQELRSRVEQMEAEKEEMVRRVARTEAEKEQLKSGAEHLEAEVKELRKGAELKQKTEVEEAVRMREEELCAQLDTFLADQKQRYLGAMEQLRQSHLREKEEAQRVFESAHFQLRTELQEVKEKFHRSPSPLRAPSLLQSPSGGGVPAELQEWQRRAQEAEAKHAILKKKVRAYHRHVHQVEREHAELLLALSRVLLLQSLQRAVPPAKEGGLPVTPSQEIRKESPKGVRPSKLVEEAEKLRAEVEERVRESGLVTQERMREGLAVAKWLTGSADRSGKRRGGATAASGASSSGRGTLHGNSEGDPWASTPLAELLLLRRKEAGKKVPVEVSDIAPPPPSTDFLKKGEEEDGACAAAVKRFMDLSHRLRTLQIDFLEEEEEEEEEK